MQAPSHPSSETLRDDGHQDARDDAPGDARRDVDHTIPVLEERVEIGRRRVETGRVRVVKRVRERVAVVAEPIVREDVRVERRPINREVSPDAIPQIREDGDRTIIPVLEEIVVVERRLVLREELHIIRSRRTEVNPQRVVLRSEEAGVERIDPAGGLGASNHAIQGASMTHSVAAVFEDRATAEAARQDLLQAGFAENQVSIQASDTLPEDVRTRVGRDRDEGVIEHFFRSLFGFEEDTAHYAEATRRGLSVVVVFSEDDAGVNRAHEVLARRNPTDIEDHAERWREDGWNPPTAAALSARPEAHGGTTNAGTTTGGTTTMGTTTMGATTAGTDASAMSAADRERAAMARGTAGTRDVTGQEHIPVIQEELRVGKRAVRRGGVRIYASVIEQPVEESVRLREERAFVERRAVDRPATEADLGTFQEGTLEVSETAEEPVVGKTRRVVEEIDVGKRTNERTETIRDTVRKTDVRVENLDEAPVADRGKTVPRKDTDKPR